MFYSYTVEGCVRVVLILQLVSASKRFLGQCPEKLGTSVRALVQRFEVWSSDESHSRMDVYPLAVAEIENVCAWAAEESSNIAPSVRVRVRG